MRSKTYRIFTTSASLHTTAERLILPSLLVGVTRHTWVWSEEWAVRHMNDSYQNEHYHHGNDSPAESQVRWALGEEVELNLRMFSSVVPMNAPSVRVT